MLVQGMESVKQRTRKTLPYQALIILFLFFLIQRWVVQLWSSLPVAFPRDSSWFSALVCPQNSRSDSFSSQQGREGAQPWGSWNSAPYPVVCSDRVCLWSEELGRKWNVGLEPVPRAHSATVPAPGVAPVLAVGERRAQPLLYPVGSSCAWRLKVGRWSLLAATHSAVVFQVGRGRGGGLKLRLHEG